MPLFNFLPVGDWRNDGWSLVGSGVSALYQALANDDDTKYIKSPASKNGAAVTFPVDTTSVPEGAVITSITLKARISLGAGSAPPGTAPSVTFSIAAQDDTSRYTTRTIQVTTGSPTTVEIATYQRDALGYLWDVFRLNYLFCRVFTYVGIADLIRLYKLFCEIKYRVRPTITVDAPTGTVLTPSPVIAWTYTQTDGDPQKYAEFKLFTAEQVSQISFNPDTAAPVYYQKVEGTIGSVLLPTSINPNDYYVYVRAVSSFGAKSVWVGRAFTVSGPAPGTPGVDDPSGLLPLGTATISVVPDRERGAAALTLRDTSNLLTAQEGDAESSIDGAQFITTNATVVRDTSTAYPGGTASWKMTATGAGDMSITSDWIEVLPSLAITARAQFRAATTGRNVRCRIMFYDTNFALLSTSTGTQTTNGNTSWIEASVTADIPGDTVYARAVFDVIGAAAAEVHNVDRLGVMYGSNTPWSDGGHASRNLLSSFYASPGGTAQAGEAWTPNAATTVTTAAPIGTGGSGSLCNRMTYAGTSPSIAFRAAGTAFTSPTSGVDYTLNKPAGVVSGDLMLAFVTSSEYSSVNPPAGWTLVNSARVDDGTTDTSLFVLKRLAGGTEPASWTDGTVTASSSRRTAVVVAYSGAADVLGPDVQTATGNATPLYLTTPSVNNTAANAWRVSSFAVSDDATGGTLTANKQVPSTVPGISHVAAGTPWGTYSSGSSYTINKPSGLVTNDVMIAVVTASTSVTITPPTGWSMVRQTSSSSGNFVQAVMYRVVTASEPASWSGTLSAAANIRITTSNAYRNVNTTTPFITHNSTTASSGNLITTPTVTNTNSLAWRVVAISQEGTNTAYELETNEVATPRHRYLAYTGGGFFGGSVNSNEHIWADSNGPVSTGSHSRTGNMDSGSWYGAVGFIGILNPLGTPPSPVADETVRATTTVGSSNPWMTTRVFDSGGVIAAGSQSITGIWTPGSGSDKNSMAGWQGIILPAAPATSGYAAATMATAVDISAVNIDEIFDSDRVTVTASFIGSTAGTPYLTVNFYRANQLLNSLVEQGTSFGTSIWVKSVAMFDVPEGTTRMTVGVSVSDRVVSDQVYWDRVSLAFGDDPVYRGSTSRATHPIWGKPQIQYADDDGTGYSEWADLPGMSSNPAAFEPLSGEALYTDHTPIPLTNRKYRARTTTFGLNGDLFVSAWSADSSEYSFEARNWWLKDIANPDNNIELKVSWGDVPVTTTNTSTVFYPIGEDLPVVLSEGYKGDVFTLHLKPVSHAEWAELKAMLKSGRTLFLQSDIDHAWWVRPVDNLGSTVMPTGGRQSNPLRDISISFVQVKPEM